MSAEPIHLKKANPRVNAAIQREITNRRSLYQERDNIAHQLRRLRLMRHSPYMPKQYQRQLGGRNAIKVPIMYRLVQTAVNAVAKGLPTVYVEPFTATDRRAADEEGKALNLLIQAMDRTALGSLLYSLYFNIFGDGIGITKVQTGPWAGFPLPSDGEEPQAYLQRYAEFAAKCPLPFVCRTVDPLTFYPPMDEYGEGATIESGWRNMEATLRSLSLAPLTTSAGGFGLTTIPEGQSYPDLEFPPGMPPNTRVDEIWTENECAVSIAGTSDIWIFEHPYGNPYTWGFAEPSGVHDPANVGMSVVYPLLSIAPWLDTMVGIMTAWSLFAAPTPYTTQDPIPGVRPTQETKVEYYQPGKMYHFPTGRKPGVLSPPPVGDAVLGFINFLVEASDKGGLPALVSGGGVGTRLPALTFQAAFEAATDRLLPAVQGAEHVIEGTLIKACNIIGRYDIPVKVNGWEYASTDAGNKMRQWATIKPAEVRKGRQITVKLGLDSTQDLIAKGTHAQFMVSAQLWDVAHGMRFAGVKNVQQTKDNIAADTAWRAALPVLANIILQSDPDFQAMQQEQLAAQAAEEGVPTAPEGRSIQTAQGRQEESLMAQGAGGVAVTELDIGGEGMDYPGAPPGPGRNRGTVPAGRGGGARGVQTHKPRGNRQSPYGKT